MLKYIQDLDFGKVEPTGTLRQKKVFCLKTPLQNLTKNRSVSQLMHDELITLQKSSSRKNHKNNSSQSIANIIRPFQISPPQSTELPIIQSPVKTKVKKRKQFILKNSNRQEPTDEQWSETYYASRCPSISPPIKEIKRVLQDSFTDKSLQSSFSLGSLRQSAESPVKRSTLVNEKFFRCLLADYVMGEKIRFLDLVPESKIKIKDVDYMMEQVCMNFDLLKQIFRLDRTIAKVLIKTTGVTKKIIHTFFKEIKPNCPNDVSKFDEYFKLRKNISKDLIQSKFIVGHEPEYESIIRKILSRDGDAFSFFLIKNQQEDPYQQMLKQMEPSELLQKALDSIKFDYEYFNKLNYFNINLQDAIKSKQVKAIRSKILLNNSNVELPQIISLDFEQPESIVQKLTDMERRLGKFNKISVQERFKYLEAEAYLFYR